MYFWEPSWKQPFDNSLYLHQDFSLPYQSFLLPAGLILSKKWARGYNVVLFIFVLILGVILPACAAFHQEQSTWDFDATVCDCLIYIHLCDFVIPLAVVIMFLMEAYISSISTGEDHLLQGLLLKLILAMDNGQLNRNLQIFNLMPVGVKF